MKTSIQETIKCPHCKRKNLARWRFENLEEGKISLFKKCNDCRNGRPTRSVRRNDQEQKTSFQRSMKYYKEYKKIYLSIDHKKTKREKLNIETCEILEFLIGKTLKQILNEITRKVKNMNKSNSINDKREEQYFLHEHRNDFLFLSQFDEWPEKLPEGHSVVMVGRGARNDFESFPQDMETKLLIVPSHEIKPSPRSIIDVEKYPALLS